MGRRGTPQSSNLKLSQQIREELAEGPATTREIAFSLGITLRETTVGLRLLKKQRHVQVTGTVPNLEYGRGQRKQLKLYALTVRGQTCARMGQQRAAGAP